MNDSKKEARLFGKAGLPAKPRLSADLAAAAYGNETDAARRLRDIGWRMERWIAVDDTECFVAVNDTGRHAAVAFRGTEPAQLGDWLTDLNARQVSWAHGRVHAGFLQSVDKVFAELWPLLTGLSSRGVSLHFTGHSKGAAEATLTAARLRAAQVPVAGLCTFGSPRVGDATFAAWMDAVLPFGIQRYVNNNDVVARVPLPAKWIASFVPFGWLLPVGYRHCGALRYVAASGEILENPRVGRLCADRLKGRWRAGRHWLSDGLRDHAMWRYREIFN
ncbi:MAG: lipase family protein [Planctomycetaceae bacterium]